MATAFRIHEDIENHMEPSKKITSARNDQILTEKIEKHHHQQQQRSTLAVLNNVQKNNVAGGRNSAAAHAQKTAFNVLQPKSTVLKSNNENITLKVFNPKLDTKFNVEPYKPFSVVEQENRIFDQVSDENKPPVTNDDEVDHVVIANISIPGIRQPLQEIPHDTETPICMRDLLSPMSIDKSIAESELSLMVDESNVSTTSTKRFSWKNDLDKFFEVEEYRDDILDYLREAELRHRPKAMYMRKQPDISHSMRTILIDWLVEVGEEYRLQNETLCLAVSYIDRFLSVMSVVRAKLQLVGTAAMFIAAKYEEIYPPDVSEFVYITDNTYTKKQVLRMEQLILKVLTFDLCVPTTSVFLNAYPLMDDIPAEVKFMAQYFSELSLLEAEPFLQYPPSMLSAAAIALARLNCGLDIWTSQLERCTCYKIEKLAEIVLHLSNSHCNAVNLPQQAIQDKYKNNKYLEVSTRTPLRLDETTLSKAIKRRSDYSDGDRDVDGQESNENVRKMISSLLSVS